MENRTNLKDLQKPVVLCGMMAAGKTTVGRNLAAVTGLDFVDLDKEIERREDKSVPEIFTEYGEEEFRRLERQVLAGLWQEPKIIALGGGALQTPEFAEKIKQHSLMIYLNVSVSILVNRLSGKKNRPKLRNADGSWKTGQQLQEYIRNLLSERQPLYQKAHIIVDIDKELSPRKITEHLLQKIQCYAEQT